MKLPASDLVEILQHGGIGVLATDTLYGVVGLADRPGTVERIYRLKGRHPDKPLIILIAQISDMDRFGVKLTERHRSVLSESWPGPVSVIVPCPDREGVFAYLHRGTHTLAFRMPAKPYLRRLITRTGPLVAPSANPQGDEPASTITAAQGYFGNHVDFYRRGRTNTKPSRLLRVGESGVEVLRP